MLTLADAAGVALGFVLTLADADGVALGFVLTLADADGIALGFALTLADADGITSDVAPGCTGFSVFNASGVFVSFGVIVTTLPGAVLLQSDLPALLYSFLLSR